ncbi:UNVERIFIED_CONTAM: hypothetical protein FKN15_059173 [Acipenser sinensis]
MSKDAKTYGPVQVQTPFGGGAVCAGWEADTQEHQERKVEIGVSVCAAQKEAEISVPVYTAQKEVEIGVSVCAAQREAEISVPVYTAQKEAEISVPVCAAQKEVEISVPVCAAQKEVEISVPVYTAQKEVEIGVPVCAAQKEVEIGVSVCTAQKEVEISVPVCAAQKEAEISVPVYTAQKEVEIGVPVCAAQKEVEIGVSFCAAQKEVEIGVPVCAAQKEVEIGVPVCAAQKEVEISVPVCTAQKEAEISVPVYTAQKEAEISVPVYTAQKEAEISVPVYTAQKEAEISVPVYTAQKEVEISVPVYTAQKEVEISVPVYTAQKEVEISVPVYTAQKEVEISVPVYTAQKEVEISVPVYTAQKEVEISVPVYTAQKEVEISVPVYTAQKEVEISVPVYTAQKEAEIGVSVCTAQKEVEISVPVYTAQKEVEIGVPVYKAQNSNTVWRQNGVSENKPLTVPKDIDLHLEAAPVKALDALGESDTLERSAGANIGQAKTTSKVLFTLMSHYFRSEEGGERSVCLAFGFLTLLIAMLVLVVRDEYLEFGLEPGFANLFDNLEIFLRQQGWEWSVPFTKLTVKLGLAAFCSFIGALLAFPGLRLAQTHLDALKMTSDRPIMQILLHASFLSPVIVVLLWVKPITRDFLQNAPLGKQSVTLMSSSTFDSVRLWTVVVLCALRLAVTRIHLQAYLNLADRWVQQMKREAGRIAAIDIQRKVTRIFCYLTVVTLQYLGPILLMLFSTLLLKSMGDYSWGLYPESPRVTPAVRPAPVVLSPSLDEEGEEIEEDIQVTVARVSEALGSLRSIFTPLFYRGLFSFLTWWVAACQLITSLFGVYFHQYLMQS